uniref:Uncharacterized protein n=1 Tax=Oryza sativa subsp. japonica TaxID=39947 RepID=Q69S40_ORYSJ|nr:hypothetical protein [Oryza sativa Japonica Group]
MESSGERGGKRKNEEESSGMDFIGAGRLGRRTSGCDIPLPLLLLIPVDDVVAAVGLPAPLPTSPREGLRADLPCGAYGKEHHAAAGRGEEQRLLYAASPASSEEEEMR